MNVTDWKVLRREGPLTIVEGTDVDTRDRVTVGVRRRHDHLNPVIDTLIVEDYQVLTRRRTVYSPEELERYRAISAQMDAPLADGSAGNE